MTYKKIDLKTWERKEHFDGFMASGTSFSLTTKINVNQFYKRVKAQKFKFYPAFIHQVTQTVNEFDCFKVGFNEEEELILWEKLEPNYTIKSQVSDNFVCVWTCWKKDFSIFNQGYQETVRLYESSKQLAPQKDMPLNILPISMIPWVSFEGFNLNIKNNDTFLAPIITGGKLVEEHGELLMPIAIQVHHATCDGYHVAQFIERLQTNLEQFQG